MDNVRIRSTSPHAPDDVVIDVPAVDASSVAAVAGRARQSGNEWRRAAAGQRSSALTAAAEHVETHGEELAALIVREVGKPVTEARGEVARTASILRYYAQAAYGADGDMHTNGPAGFAYTSRRPHGVVGLITPWNFPLAIPIWKAAPALAFGNAVLLKPSPDSTGCALRLAELFDDVLPAGLFTVLPGGAETGEALIHASDAVSFTGSAGVGRTVVATMAALGKPVQAEMGGLNASVVLPDAPVEATAASIAGAIAGYAGQKCTATSRVIVVGDSAEFSAALAAAVEHLRVGDPSDPNVAVGPVISQAAQQKVVIVASEAGGEILTGGRPGSDAGWFVAPTLIRDPEPRSTVAVDEVFGPIATISSVATVAEATERVNGTRFGLVTSVYGSALENLLPVVDAVDTGMVRVNQPTTGVDFWLPFGGEKDSSYGGREQGVAARDFYTSSRTVSVSAHV